MNFYFIASGKMHRLAKGGVHTAKGEGPDPRVQKEQAPAPRREVWEVVCALKDFDRGLRFAKKMEKLDGNDSQILARKDAQYKRLKERALKLRLRFFEDISTGKPLETYEKRDDIREYYEQKRERWAWRAFGAWVAEAMALGAAAGFGEIGFGGAAAIGGGLLTVQFAATQIKFNHEQDVVENAWKQVMVWSEEKKMFALPIDTPLSLDEAAQRFELKINWDGNMRDASRLAMILNRLEGLKKDKKQVTFGVNKTEYHATIWHNEIVVYGSEA